MLWAYLAAVFAMFAAAAYAAGDIKRGEELYVRCAACHSLAHERVGPRHCGLVDRRAGTLAGFDYSDAMKKSGIVWDAKTLDRFIADPMKTVPGTTMTYAGVTDQQERADLVAYLVWAANEAPECKGHRRNRR